MLHLFCQNFAKEVSLPEKIYQKPACKKRWNKIYLSIVFLDLITQDIAINTMRKNRVHKIYIVIFSLFLLLHLCAERANAQHRGQETSLAAPIDTLQTGLEYQQQIDDIFSLRMGKIHFSYSDNLPENIFFSRQEKNLHRSAIADYRPWTGGFRLSAGVFYNDQLYGGEQSITGIGNTLPFSATLEQQRFMAPYLGMGWGSTSGSKESWMFTLDVGLLYQGQDNSSCQSASWALSSSLCRGNL